MDRHIVDEQLDDYREFKLSTEEILRQSLSERNHLIKALEQEVSCLLNMVSALEIDSRFWIGLPVRLRENFERCRSSERRRRVRMVNG